MKKRFNRNNFGGKIPQGPKNIGLVLVVFLSLIALTQLTDYSRSVSHISHSQFLKEVEANNVKKVAIYGNEVEGYYKDNSRFETKIGNNPRILDLLREHDVDFTTDEPMPYMWYFFLLGLLGLLAAGFWFMVRQGKQMGGNNGPGNLFGIGRSRAKLIMPQSINVNFNSVAGAEEAKADLKEVVDFLKDPQKYRRLGAKVTRGILLIGEPGNGKTLLAKAVAGEANCPFFSITGSDFVEMFVGVGAARVRDLFAQARKHSPCIVFIDEIDAVGRQRGVGLGGGNDEREQTLNQLLTELDGFETTNSASNIIVIAATNQPEVLDKALLRPGRFDRRIVVPYPHMKHRLDILKIHSTRVKLGSDVNLDAIADETPGFTGADLENLINTAAIIASRRLGEEYIMHADLEAARKKIVSEKRTDTTAATSNFKVHMPSTVKVKFADVAGNYEAKEELQEVVEFLKNPEKHRRLGARIPRGVLLVGEPGNGKTLLAKAVAGEANCQFISTAGSDFVQMYVGMGAARVREMFKEARKSSPCIIFIDEIDAIGRKRGDTGDGGGQEYAQTLNQLLTELDGFDTQEGDVIIIGATNIPSALDKALLRPGRFDRQVEIPYPDLKSREAILKLHAAKISLDDSVDLQKLARGTPGFTGADLANLVNEAALYATKDLEKQTVGMHDFEEARDKIILGKKSQSMVLTENDRKITAFHEAGHALVRLLNPEHADPLHKITIIPRGQALGVTHSLPEREKYNRTKREFEVQVMSALGGRAAEVLVFDEFTTGAYSDFKAATDIVRNMVTKYGMSDNVGSVIYTQNYGEYKYSEKTAESIDKEVKEILDRLMVKTLDLLKTNRDKLDILSNALLEKETMYAGEIYPLLGLEPRPDFKLV
jgi:cell division protease FtsH